MRRCERPLATVLIAAAGALLAAHAARSLPFFADDGFISLRYAQRLLAGQGLTWTDGEAVEGYSNLLWVLGCAALAAAGLDLVVAARLLGGLGSLAALLAVVAAARPRSAFAAAAGALVLAGSGSIAVWSFGGLEQPLLAALFAWACVLAFPLLEGAGRGWFAPGALLALACLTRPDGVLLVAGAVGGVVLARPRERASLDLGLKLAGLPALALAGQLAFRLAYYGEWWPNTAYVKLAAGAAQWPLGLVYVLEGLAFLLPLVVLVAAL